MSTDMKKCKTCREVKPVSEYYYNKRYKGYFWECKACNNIRRRDWSINNPEKARRQKRKLKRDYRTKYPGRYFANNKVGSTLRNGTLHRPDFCSCCNKACKPQAHHPNYNKPLEVQWLCEGCHKKFHADIRVFLTNFGNIFNDTLS